MKPFSGDRALRDDVLASCHDHHEDDDDVWAVELQPGNYDGVF